MSVTIVLKQFLRGGSKMILRSKVLRPLMGLGVVGVLALGTMLGLSLGSLAGTASADPAAPNPGHLWSELEYHGTAGDPINTYWLGTPFSEASEALELRVWGVRALRLEPNATSPNVIGGYSGNWVTTGVSAASISGGGAAAAYNRVTDSAGTVGGGIGNQAGDNAGTTEDQKYATVGGGLSNTASGQYATVGGGSSNRAEILMATVGGGNSNVASGVQATVGGGSGNVANSQYATIGGGYHNDASALFATIGGGGTSDTGNPDTSNRVTDNYGTVGGGGNNQAGNNAGGIYDREYGTVGGGKTNTASGSYSTVDGGRSNTASGQYSTVGGGGEAVPGSPLTANSAKDDYDAVGGGGSNQAGTGANAATYATICGGYDNEASDHYATVGGGYGNKAQGARATVPGGSDNIASGQYSFAAGRQAQALDDGSFVWADSTGGVFSSASADQFRVRANGGVHLQVNNGGGMSIWESGLNFITTMTGARLTLAGVWTNASDAALKENFTAVDGQTVLANLAEMPISNWNSKAEDASIRHMGPTAQDFYAAFGLGDSDTSIGTVDADGVALAAIQGLYQLSQEQGDRIQALEDENASLNQRLDSLETRVSALEGGSDAGAAVSTASSSGVPALWPVLGGGVALVLVGLVLGRRLAAGRP